MLETRLVIALLLLLISTLALAQSRPSAYTKAGPLDDRFCRVESRPGGPITGNPADWVADIAAAGIDLWVFSAVDANCDVNYPSQVGYPSGDFDPTYIKEAVRLAHLKDIAVISWLGPTWSKGAGQAHPDWNMVLLDDPSREVPEGINVGWLCPNIPEAKAFLKTEITEILTDLDFDGLWFDGTVFGSMLSVPFYAGCKCPFCRARYKTETGFEVPESIDLGDINFRRFVRWRYDVMREHMQDLYEAAIAARPDAHVAFGNYYRPGHGWDCGTPLSPWNLPVCVSGENNIVGDMAWNTTNTGFNARMIKAINPYSFELWRPVWDFQIGFPPQPDPVQTTVSLLLEFAQGGHSFCGWSSATEDMAKCLGPAFAELKKRAAWHGGEPLTYAAMHYSQRARDFSYPGGMWEYDKMASGIYQALAESHIIFDFVLDGQLTAEYLEKYPVVILPSSGCLSDQEAIELQQYVSKGGHLIVCGETGLYDDLGVKREDFVLADLLGIHYQASKLQGAYPATSPVGVLEENFRSEASPSRLYWFVSPYCEFTVDPASSARPVLRFTAGNDATTGGAGENVPATDQPLAVLRKIGAGEVIYIGADLGMGYAGFPYPRIRQLIASWANRAKPWLEVQAPKVIEVTAFEREGKRIIHLTNSPLTSLRPTVMRGRMPLVDEVVPVHDIVVSIKGRYKNVRLEPSGLDLQPEWEDGWTTVTVPKVALHEMVIFD